MWNTKITDLPVAHQSAQWVAAIDAGDPAIHLHPDFGPGGGLTTPYGIPFTIVTPGQPFVHVSFEYASGSDRGPYPFGPTTPIEGGENSTGDRHALMLDPKTCTLYELFDAHYLPDAKSTAGFRRDLASSLESTTTHWLDVGGRGGTADSARARHLRGGRFRSHRSRDPVHRT